MSTEFFQAEEPEHEPSPYRLIPPSDFETIDYILQDFCRQADEEFGEIAMNLLSQVENKSSLDFDSLRSTGIYCADIEENLETLLRQACHYDELGIGGHPCLLHDGMCIPIADKELAPGHRVTEHAMTHTRWGSEVVVMSFTRAFSRSSQALRSFIVRRLAAKRFQKFAAAGGIGGSNNMIPIDVHSPTVGARVSYSPSYFINFTVLSSPTSPASGMVHPGRYVFMLTTRGPTNAIDQGMFNIPPDNQIHLSV